MWACLAVTTSSASESCAPPAPAPPALPAPAALRHGPGRQRAASPGPGPGPVRSPGRAEGAAGAAAARAPSGPGPPRQGHGGPRSAQPRPPPGLRGTLGLQPQQRMPSPCSTAGPLRSAATQAHFRQYLFQASALRHREKVPSRVPENLPGCSAFPRHCRAVRCDELLVHYPILRWTHSCRERGAEEHPSCRRGHVTCSSTAWLVPPAQKVLKLRAWAARAGSTASPSRSNHNSCTESSTSFSTWCLVVCKQLMQHLLLTYVLSCYHCYQHHWSWYLMKFIGKLWTHPSSAVPSPLLDCCHK